MSSRVTLKVSDLMNYYGLTEEDCDREIEKAHSEDMSRALAKDWRLLPSRFDLPEILESDIERDFKTEKERRNEFFRRWKEIDGSSATYRRLMLSSTLIAGKMLRRCVSCYGSVQVLSKRRNLMKICCLPLLMLQIKV